MVGEFGEFFFDFVFVGKVALHFYKFGQGISAFFYVDWWVL